MSKDPPHTKDRPENDEGDGPKIILTDFLDVPFESPASKKEVTRKGSKDDREFLGKLGSIVTRRFLKSFDEFCALFFAALSIYGVYKFLEFLAEKEENAFEIRALKVVIFFIEGCLLLKYLWDVITKEHTDSDE